jgi:hypothetical protein
MANRPPNDDAGPGRPYKPDHTFNYSNVHTSAVDHFASVPTVPVFFDENQAFQQQCINSNNNISTSNNTSACPGRVTLRNNTPPRMPDNPNNDASNDRLRSIVAAGFEEGHGYRPYQWQIDHVLHVLNTLHCNPNVPRPILINRSTGGGKSACRNTIGFLLGGVVLTIVPLLSLGSDQTQKLLDIIIANHLPASVYHLDEFLGTAANRDLISLLSTLENNPSDTIFLFSSPQKIANSTEWTKCFHLLIQRPHVPFSIFLDECHLYASMGIEFRKEFGVLKEALFDFITIYRPSTPIVHMTATASAAIIDDLESLTGVAFDTDLDLLWSTDPKTVSRRQVGIDLIFQESPLRSMKSYLRLQPPASNEKFILYTNSRRKCNALHSLICDFLDEEAIPGDLVVVHGELFREQKFHHIQSFVSDDVSLLDERSKATITFRPWGLFATSGSVNAGLDCGTVCLVFRDGYPLNLRDLVQEAGRCGRNNVVDPNRNVYRVFVSWKSFQQLLFRIYIVPILEVERLRHETQADVERSNISTNGSANVRGRHYLDCLLTLLLERTSSHAVVPFIITDFCKLS